MEELFVIILIGILAGMASGAFGLGGATVVAPLLRILTETSGHDIVGTTLPLVIPAALSGIYVYYRRGMVRWDIVLASGLPGAAFSVLGAFATSGMDEGNIMVVLSIALLAAAGMASIGGRAEAASKPQAARAAAIGTSIGFLSGLLGIGGGAFLVPLFVLFLGLTFHEAVASSLGVVVLYAVPGTLAHLSLGNVETGYLLPLLVCGVIGAQFGSRFAMGQDERHLRLLLVSFYLLMGALLLLNELVLGGAQ